MTKALTLIVASVLTLTCLAGCADRGLSRAVAVAAINASSKFPIADSRVIRNQCEKSNHDGHLFHWVDCSFNRNSCDSDGPLPDIQHFVAIGLLTTAPMIPIDDRYSRVTLSLTDRAKAWAVPTNNRGSNLVKICDVVFGEITGIQGDEQAGSAVVEYSVRRVNWTPFGEYYKQQQPGGYPDVVGQTAVFTSPHYS